MDDDHSDPQKVNGPTTEELAAMQADQWPSEVELLPAVAMTGIEDPIEPYALASEVDS